ncbi:hypothetical protein GMLC_33540 [Geomonas limicola]|uniref:Helix-turn-helix domain-containing protein n=1 Tax=Geomonas limicola TaxID=2740186 RepID=A0A6V8NAY1_9BACT|nr:DNA-binding protein [Geomonas limicola]GFO69775.1 hypothetical protein GMLC_33540 [Geomonas limicola]
MTVDNEALFSLSEVARQLGTTETRILMLVKQGVLKGELVEGNWWIYQSSLAGVEPESARVQLVPSCKTSCNSGTCGCHYDS